MNEREMLQKLEWSGHRRGQGSGFMGSGGDGLLYRACPVCRGLEKPNAEFAPGAVGHRADCDLHKVLSSDCPAGDSEKLAAVAQAYRDLAALQRTQKQTMAAMVRACIQRLRSPDSRKRSEAIDALASLADMLEKEGN